MPVLLERYELAGAGIAIIREGRVVWTGYFGEQAPGIAVTADTRFNTASIAKTIAAELVLRLAAAGELSLDAPVSVAQDFPALANDRRGSMLTARRMLSHQAGLLNWPYEYADGELAFVADPGSSYSYSGIAYELLARAVARQQDESFARLVQRHVFDPIEMPNASVRSDACEHARAAVPMDADGVYLPRCSHVSRTHEASAADDLHVTVDDYARFLIAVASAEGLTAALATERTRIHTSLADDPVWRCEERSGVRCADVYGYGLGWMVYRYGDVDVIKHGGNDRGENALAYISPQTGDGAVIFVNGGNGIRLTVDVLELIDADMPLAAYYRQLLERHYAEP